MRIGLLAAPAAAVFATIGLAVPVQAAPATECDGTLAVGTYERVVVESGADCVLQEGTVVKSLTVRPGGSITTNGVEVTHNVMSRSAEFVRLIETNVGRNVKVRDTVGNVTIGSEGCRIDPTVGNNVMVDDTGGNVAICFVQAKNNIKVTDTGKNASVLNSCAGNNIFVNRTELTARVRDSEFGNHLFMRRNGDNVDRRNTQGDCMM